MFMSREIMHCRPGMAKDLVAKFKTLSNAMTTHGYPPSRIYTDVSGENYWTVVVEQDIDNIDELAEMSRTTAAGTEFADALKGYHELVLNGRRELYKLE